MLRVKRIYDKASPRDGVRVLVDRIWPRGLSKREARIDHWMKDIAPSTALRKWFNHDANRWREFKRRYFQELRKDRSELVEELARLAATRTVTILYSAKDREHNQGEALREYLSRLSNR
ncbi:MAG: DUF488 family protein [Acidiferrobacterales bacterium]|nr:DUF488 family protein [Acidiferrobacterales bacterium]